MSFRKIDLQNVKTDTAHINDPLIVINNGISGTNDRDVGIIFDRGSSSNVAMIWDEVSNTFSFINTTETGSTVGDVAISSYANLTIHTLTGTLSGNVLGNVTGNITSTGTSTFSNIDVAGGEIDNTSIGTNTRAPGAFTTLNTDGDVIIGGNLVVGGTATTINTETLTLQDPLINLGGTTAPTTTDGKDRGISFRWHNGSNPKLGFIGFDTSDNKFTFVPDAVINNEVLTGGAKGDVDFGDVGGTSATINGNISGYTSTLESSTLDAMLTLTCTDSSSVAGPVVDLIRSSSTPQNSDYLGQIKFKGRNSTSNVKVYAKITGKAEDVDNGTEDGIIEFSHIKAGSQNISGRWNSSNLTLINGTGLRVDGDVIVNGSSTFYSSISVTGDIVATGDVTAYSSSDIKLKENIIDIDHALDKVKSIRGVQYDWKDEHLENNKHLNKKDVGVIAQEVEKVLPEIVSERDIGIKAVRYERLTALLIEAVKELSSKVDKQQEQINKFKRQIDGI